MMLSSPHPVCKSQGAISCPWGAPAFLACEPHLPAQRSAPPPSLFALIASWPRGVGGGGGCTSTTLSCAGFRITMAARGVRTSSLSGRPVGLASCLPLPRSGNRGSERAGPSVHQGSRVGAAGTGRREWSKSGCTHTSPGAGQRPRWTPGGRLGEERTGVSKERRAALGLATGGCHLGRGKNL